MVAVDNAHMPSNGKLVPLPLLRSSHDEALKPQELIQIKGHAALTLYARRAITLLWHNAHRQGIAAGKDYTIEIEQLKSEGHKGQEAVEAAVELLMKTILVVELPGGKTRRVQFLGGNDMDDADRKAGVLTYSFDKRLTEILESSSIFGQISLPVVRGFTSKYAISLYENISQKVGLTYVQSKTYSTEEFREMVGVLDGKYPVFGDLNRHVIKPAVAEINVMANFIVTVLPVKRGKKVEQLTVGWYRKDEAGLQSAQAEIDKAKKGRRERAASAEQLVLQLMPSSERLALQARKAARRAG